MIEEQARVQVAGKIDLKQAPGLVDVGDVVALPRTTILPAALVMAANLRNTWSGRTPKTTGAKVRISSKRRRALSGSMDRGGAYSAICRYVLPAA